MNLKTDLATKLLKALLVAIVMVMQCQSYTPHLRALNQSTGELSNVIITGGRRGTLKLSLSLTNCTCLHFHKQVKETYDPLQTSFPWNKALGNCKITTNTAANWIAVTFNELKTLYFVNVNRVLTTPAISGPIHKFLTYAVLFRKQKS